MRRVVMTRCPVGGASEIALRKGWLREAFLGLGAELVMLQSLPEKEHVKHYTQEPPLTFRDGGNVPPIWSHSRGVKTKVIALTAVKQSHALIVAPDSGIRSVEELRGKKLSIPDFEDAVIDFLRAMTLRGYDTILKGFHIGEDEVRFVKTKASLRHNRRRMDEEGRGIDGEPDKEPEDFISEHAEQLKELKEGKIDGFFAHRSLVGQIVNRGLGKVLIDIADSDLDPVNNIYPSVITVDEEFANNNRDLVVAYLRQLLRASRWAKGHGQELAEIASGSQYGATEQDILATRKTLWDPGFSPNLETETVRMLGSQKEFLLEHGFITADFSLKEWIDPSYLEEALQSPKQ